MAAEVLRSAEEAAAFSRSVHRAGKRLALVPTMGFLHDGHLSLMKEGRARADVVAVSIFVNPTQFAPTDDLSRYPRDFEGDRAKCEGQGVEAIRAPEPATVYPAGFQTYVHVGALAERLDGKSRPGHFRGVATVVTKLFALLRPNVALFGEKDFQQLQIIRRLNQDLNLGVDVVGLPTVREPDGLAMSSRNSYLSAEERARALSISRGMDAAAQRLKDGQRDTAGLIGAVRAHLEKGQVVEDYIDVVDAASLLPLSEVVSGQAARLLVAGFVGKTRLIDNRAL